jgi:hypothetical protein
LPRRRFGPISGTTLPKAVGNPQGAQNTGVARGQSTGNSFTYRAPTFGGTPHSTGNSRLLNQG